ncbi:response regulator [Ureibacillus chungkukjangi]|uniref:Transcriptional regulatory protein n=1 Tax=Ureibacillus chungkukjangi TaxID=1202712 RepID=A0A318TAC9_9BACL|nr:response regulator [Ureibacillus chungkukjangi]PYF02062.1 response regulator of citrate/malate metabolism [Ureibacillus chungkukjangi]
MNIKAVIAEDDFRVAAIHEKFLGNFKSIEVVGKALNGKDTIEFLKEHNPELLLLDVYMPDQLGTELLPIIRKQFPHIDIIMITAATDKEILLNALNYGVEQFLIKPVKRELFNQTIEEYLQKFKLIESKQEVDQDFVNQLLKKSTSSSYDTKESSLPKGIDEITLVKVSNVLKSSDSGLSAEQVSEQIGASRITARRYLEYLITVKECKAEVVYGAVGRPERRYYKV